MPNAKRRLLFVITLSEWGGAQSYTLNTAKEAVRRGYDVLVAAGGHDELAKQCHLETIPYRELHRLKRSIVPFADIPAVNELKRVMVEWKPDIAFLHSSKAGVLGSLAAKKANVPRVVYRIGGWSFLDPVSPIQKWIRRRAEQHTAALKDAIIVLHPDDEALAKKYHILPKDELAVIPNGIDIQRFDWDLVEKKLARQQLQMRWARGRESADDPPLILTIANFFSTKGLLGYLDAIAIVHNQKPDVRFLILGDGGQRAAIESKRRALGLENVVSLPGIVRSAATLLRGADAFVLPSIKEGMPWALLEAMAAALPCIATDVGASRWMLGENGWIVPAADADALAGAVFAVLRDPVRAHAKGEAARRDVAWRFTAERMREETFRILEG